MSQENVEVVRRIYQALPNLEAVRDLFCPDYEMDLRTLRRISGSCAVSIKMSVTKDARSTVNDGLLDGPILRTECDATSGGPKDLSSDTGQFECLAVNKEQSDGSYEGYRYTATINYATGEYRWRLGGESP